MSPTTNKRTPIEQLIALLAEIETARYLREIAEAAQQRREHESSDLRPLQRR